MQDYETVRSRAEAAFIEKKSEFIGNIAPVSTEDEAVAFINEIRSAHRKATHNVYAYLLREQNILRYSDDGEPQGTAGVPVLEVLRKEGLTDACCVVTRYFGGVLLGGGGLVRAYSHGAKIAVDAAGRKILRVCRRLEITLGYDLYGKISYVLPEYEVKLEDTQFGPVVKIILLVKENLAEPLCRRLTDLTNALVSIGKSDELFEDFA